MRYTKKQLLKKLAELYGESHEDNLFRNLNGFLFYIYAPRLTISLGRTINQVYRYVDMMIQKKANNQFS